MKLRKTLAIVMLGLLVLGALAYLNRITLLQYSLGWYTDLRFPRGPEIAVPWLEGPPTPPMGQQPPNVIVILADDLGINDVSTYGAGHRDWALPTPHIDGLAARGVRFERGYAGSAVCTVSRAALMTGRYPWRFGVEFTPTPGAMARVAGELFRSEPPVRIDRTLASQAKPFDELGMPGSEITLAELLQSRGYHTLHIGKWHLGSTPQMRPNQQGFDESLFMESGLYLREDDPRVVNARQEFDPLDNFLWPNMRLAVSYNHGPWFEPGKYLTDYFTDQAVAAIHQNRHRPFFLYLAHWGVHTPLQASREDYDALAHISNHRKRVYAAMIRSVDRSVGRIVQTLRTLGLEDNTLLVFSSDNGAPGYIGIPEVNQPYRGWKLTFFEGGIRVPFVAQWPARWSAGQRHAAPVSSMDIFSTVAAAANAPLPSDRSIDGINLLPHLQTPATPARAQPERALFWRDGAYRAVQYQGWKLIDSHRPKRQWLFNLTTDPTERHDLANTRPDKLQSLQGLLEQHHAQMPAPLWPPFLEVPIRIDKTLDQPLEPGDEYTYWVN